MFWLRFHSQAQSLSLVLTYTIAYVPLVVVSISVKNGFWNLL